MNKGSKKPNQDMGRRIRELRGSMTQAEFGDRFGVAQGQVAKYEKGMMPGPMTLLNLSRATGVSVEWILMGREAADHEELEGMVSRPAVYTDHDPEQHSRNLLKKAKALRDEMESAPARELGMQATRRINDQDQAEFAAGHLKDTSLPAYTAGVLGDLVRDSVNNKDMRERIIEYYQFLKFMDEHGKLKDVKNPGASAKAPKQKK